MAAITAGGVIEARGLRSISVGDNLLTHGIAAALSRSYRDAGRRASDPCPGRGAPRAEPAGALRDAL